MKNTKAALLTSVLSLLLCVSMLVGTTFAWFTDTASTGVNKIQAGNLTVEIQDKNGDTLEGKMLKWETADGRTQDQIFWEPGARYQLEPFTIKNVGNLALKFNILITGIVGDAKLLEVIDFTYTTEDGDFDINAEHKLGAGNETKPITIKGVMKETAGNEYQDLSIDGISITVFATQDTVEKDSIDEKYDEGATLPVHVTGQQEMEDAFNNPVNGNVNIALAPNAVVELESKSNLSTVVITGDKDAEVKPKPVTGGSDYPTVYFDNADVVFEGITIDGTGNNWNSGGVCARGGNVVYKNCTINGSLGQIVADSLTLINCTINQTREEYVACLYDVAETLIEGCTFNTNGKALMVYSSRAQKVVIKDCTATDTSATAQKAFVELCDDYGNCTYDLTITNCTITGYETTKPSSLTHGGTGFGTAVWGNKNKIPASRLSVVINGVKEY